MPTIKRRIPPIILVLLLALVGGISRTGTAQTLVSATGLPAVEFAMLESADLDRDGVPEIFVSGVGSNGAVQFRIVRLESQTVDPDGRIQAVFEPIAHPIPGTYRGVIAPADYSGDEFPDLLVSGLMLDETGVGEFVERPVTSLWRSTAAPLGGRTLRQDMQGVLPALYDSGAAWGDFDGDGDVDLILAGKDASGIPATYLFRNDAGSSGIRFTEVDVELPDVSLPSFDWADFDGDGDLDLIMAGLTVDESPLIAVYVNEGAQFAKMDLDLPRLYMTQVQWGDFDVDGDLDILVSGADADPGLFRPVLRVFLNEDGMFTEVDPDVQGAFGGRTEWIDIDGDGDVDLSVMGLERIPNAEPQTRIYLQENTGGDLRQAHLLGGVQLGTSRWIDYDGNGRLDLLVVGRQLGSPARLLFAF